MAWHGMVYKGTLFLHCLSHCHCNDLKSAEATQLNICQHMTCSTGKRAIPLHATLWAYRQLTFIKDKLCWACLLEPLLHDCFTAVAWKVQGVEASCCPRKPEAHDTTYTKPHSWFLLSLTKLTEAWRLTWPEEIKAVADSNRHSSQQRKDESTKEWLVPCCIEIQCPAYVFYHISCLVILLMVRLLCVW